VFQERQRLGMKVEEATTTRQAQRTWTFWNETGRSTRRSPARTERREDRTLAVGDFPMDEVR